MQYFDFCDVRIYCRKFARQHETNEILRQHLTLLIDHSDVTFFISLGHQKTIMHVQVRIQMAQASPVEAFFAMEQP